MKAPNGLAACLVVLLFGCAAAPANPGRDRIKGPWLVQSYARVPLSFEANRGQVKPEFHFLSRAPGYALLLSSTEAVLVGQSESPLAAVVRMKLVDSNPSPVIEGVEKLPGTSNYFIGNSPHRWRTHIPTYAKIRYREVYPGVDVLFYGNPRQQEFDFVVAPGADLKRITLGFQGSGQFELGPQGELALDTEGGTLRLRKPIIYQEVNGVRREIPGDYTRTGRLQLSFQVGAYDAARPLVIDPVLSYSTYLGGGLEDEATDIAVDTEGNIYVTGSTVSTDFPATSTAFGGTFRNVFVAKLNPLTNSLVYSTVLGGTKNPDRGRGIAVDADGCAYLTGIAGSDDFPTKNAFQATCALGPLGGCEDAFITKLDPSGANLVYSTFFGSSSNEVLTLPPKTGPS